VPHRQSATGAELRTVLLVGFSQYGSYFYNTSEEVVRALHGRIVRGFKVEGVVLPVSLRVVRSVLPKILDEIKPGVVIGTGLNPSARRIILELAASSVLSFQTPDVDGCTTQFELLDGDIRVVRTSLPVKRIVEECTLKRGLPLAPSLGIGSYLCNAAGFIIMDYAERNRAVGGFIHLPPHTDLAMRIGLGFSLPLSMILKSLECVLEVTLEEHSKKFV